MGALPDHRRAWSAPDGLESPDAGRVQVNVQALRTDVTRSRAGQAIVPVATVVSILARHRQAPLLLVAAAGLVVLAFVMLSPRSAVTGYMRSAGAGRPSRSRVWPRGRRDRAQRRSRLDARRGSRASLHRGGWLAAQSRAGRFRIAPRVVDVRLRGAPVVAPPRFPALANDRRMRRRRGGGAGRGRDRPRGRVARRRGRAGGDLRRFGARGALAENR